ncbi:MAG: hypothetical protein ABWZ74_07510 [Hyphomicrobiaceae bacterium]
MIKLIFVGLWACAITLGSSWAVIAWKSGKAADAAREPDKYAGGLEQVRTKMISVPIIADGAIQGYVIVQLAFSIEAKQLKQMTIKPDAILMDEAFKTIYAGETIDFRNIKKQDLPALLKAIGDNANRRLGAPMVQDVLIQELNYVPKAEARLGEKR